MIFGTFYFHVDVQWVSRVGVLYGVAHDVREISRMRLSAITKHKEAYRLICITKGAEKVLV
jgi:hypothetical protein